MICSCIVRVQYSLARSLHQIVSALLHVTFVPLVMILRYNIFSPFARKVRVCAAELGLTARIALHDTIPQQDASLRSLNPLGKIPTLVLDDGTAIFDSPIICRYLSELVGDTRLVPRLVRDSWPAIRDEALADGMCDAAVALRTEKLRDNPLRADEFVQRQVLAIRAACDVLETRVDEMSARLDIGMLAVGCALGYLDVRHPELEWRAGRDALAEWYSALAARPSMSQTRVTDVPSIPNR